MMTHGAFFKGDVGPSPIEIMLDRVDKASGAGTSEEDATVAGVEGENLAPPGIEDFLDEEDITRECRGDNKRLITFLCKPTIVSELVALCLRVNVGGSVAEDDAFSPDPFAAGSNGVVVTEEDDEALKKRFNRSYIASELLSADVRPLADALVGEDAVFDSLFSCLEIHAEGKLDSFVAAYFAKIISSLLKTRNDETLAQMTRRRPDFVAGLLKHLNLPAIAELIVRILDGPELDRGYSQVIVAPSSAALDLLVVSDILKGLGDKFVVASKPSGMMLKDEDTTSRRLREETMTHTTLAIQGIATRVLQLPALGFPIPALLSPYATPAVVTCMLDAGLSAYMAEEPAELELEGVGVGVCQNRIAPGSTSGAFAALVHALSLVSTLMTTEDNVVRIEAADGCMMGGMATGIPGAGSRQMMLGMGGGGRGRSYGASSSRVGGIGASIQAARDREAAMAAESSDSDDDGDEEGDEEMRASVREADAAALQAEAAEAALAEANADEPEVGSPIVSTALLEGELVGAFDRLSQMFLTHTLDEAEGRPLGSLRLKLAEFFVACMKTSSQSTVDAIVSLGVPQKLLELFLRYELSSMLHGVVTQSIVSAFSGDQSSLPARKAWVDAKLVDWITSAWEASERRAEEEELRFRAGYMGHLIRMGAELQHYLNNQVQLEENEREYLFSDHQLAALAKFSDNRLGPAIQVEMTALCDGADSEGEEVYEEATEVFDVGVMDGLTQGEQQSHALDHLANYLMHRTEIEEDEVETVEMIGEVEDVGDLSHFGADDDDEEEVREVNFDGDHDIPPEMRAAMQSSSETAAPPPVAPPPALDRMAFMGGAAAPDVISEVASPLPLPIAIDSEVNAHDHEQPSIVDSEVTSMDYEGGAGGLPGNLSKPRGDSPSKAAGFGYSSDEDGDGGTYEEFVDAPGEVGDLSGALSNKLKIAGQREPLPPIPNYVPTEVTEIDDGDGEGHVTVIDEADDSSGGEEDWTQFDPATAEQQFSSNKAPRPKGAK